MTCTLSIAGIMVDSDVPSGSRGVRRLVAAMANEGCFANVCGILQHMSHIGQFASRGPVATAGYLRPSTPRILAAFAAAIRHMGAPGA